MIDDMLKLTVDQFFTDFQPNVDPDKKQFPKYAFPVNEYNDEENMWELICNFGSKKSRKEGKSKYMQPLKMNSKYAF